jgi:O-methyltransferase involved in polyketide biosynthesis
MTGCERTDTVPDERSDPGPYAGLDLTHPSAARVYDYLLGGSANWAIDREFGQRIIDRLPLSKDMVLANRVFLNRVVRHLTRLGVRQFVDIGAGVPTAGNTHQVAEQIAPDTRVVYVDNEPVAVAHAEIILNREGDPDRHAIINADLREPDELWHRARDTGILDFDQPIALLMIAVLHFFHPGPDGLDCGPASVARYRELLSPGSYLAISHLTDDGIPGDLVTRLDDVRKMYESSVSSRILYRTRAEINALFGDFQLLDPGTVWTPQWHPEDSGSLAPNVEFSTPEQAAVWAGLARKPGQ